MKNKIVLILLGTFLSFFTANAVNLIRNGDMSVQGAWQISKLNNLNIEMTDEWGYSGDSGFGDSVLRIYVSNFNTDWGGASFALYQSLGYLKAEEVYEFSYQVKYPKLTSGGWFDVFLGSEPAYNNDYGDSNGTKIYNNTSVSPEADGYYYLVIKAGGWNNSPLEVLLDDFVFNAPQPQLTANFSVSNTETVNNIGSQLVALKGKPLSFTNINPDDDATYSWNFGDGTSSLEESPVHTYRAQGLYTVTLTATKGTGEDEETSVATRIIRVLDPYMENQVIGGDMNNPDAWFLLKTTWAAQTNVSFNNNSLNIQDGGEKNVLIYQPVYLLPNKEYLFDGTFLRNQAGNYWFQVFLKNSISNDDANYHYSGAYLDIEDTGNLEEDGYTGTVGVQRLISEDSGFTVKPIEENNGGIYYLVLKAGTYNGTIDLTLDDISLTTQMPDELTWLGVNENWQNPANWKDSENVTGYLPNENIDVIIPKIAEKKYPILTGDQADNVCKNITFGPGAEIGRQDLLTYEKAFVRYDFSATASQDRWYMLSMPLQEAYSGDFTFGGYPFAYVRTFATQDDGGVTYAGWVPNKGNDTEFTAGSGFALWVESTNYIQEKGLGSLNGIIELPYHENSDELVTAARYTHEYAEGTSSFYNFKSDGNGGYVRSTTTPITVPRTSAAYTLAASPVTETLEFGQDDGEYEGVSDFALAGNPFMTTIDFTKLAGANPNIISGNYMIWSGKGGSAGFLGYTPDGTYGIAGESNKPTGLDEFIAPLQSFIVERRGHSNSTASLSFNLSAVSADATGQGTLKAATATSDKIEIVASNETASVLAFIANREYGDNTLNSRDGRKLLQGLSNVPEVYTLKENDNGEKVALGANIINSNNMLIPVGLATAYAGEMKLTFSGMANYDARIQLLDADTGETFDLTEKTDFTHTFTYRPPTEKNGQDNEIVPSNERFVLSFAPKSVTGIEDAENNSVQALVYFRNANVYAVSSPDDLIQQLYIYDMQGRLIHASDNIRAAAYSVNNLQPAFGGYIVRLTTEKGSKSVKLLFK